MKKILLILLSVSFLLQTCKKEEVKPIPPCPGKRHDVKLPVTDSTKVWIPTKEFEKIVFKNNKGFRDTFTAGQVDTTGFYGMFLVFNDCYPASYTLASRKLALSCPSVPWKISYEVVKNINHRDTVNYLQDTAGDVLVLRFRNTGSSNDFLIRLSQFPVYLENENMNELLPSFNLEGKVYSNVYHSHQDALNPEKTQPTDFYYTRKDGIIGWKFSNDEIWSRE